MEEKEVKKKVDWEWKAQIEREKKESAEKKEEYKEPTFTVYISSLVLQAMISLGRIESPITGKIEENLTQARYLIDTLALIKEKTKGNLTADEEKFLEESLFNLRMIYVEEKKKKDDDK